MCRHRVSLSLRKLAYAVILIVCPIDLTTAGALDRAIGDTPGREVSVPKSIARVYGASPPITCLIYALDPSLLAGLNFPFWPEQDPYLRPGIADLPVLGGWFGQGNIPNVETLAQIKPDLVLLWDSGFFDVAKGVAMLGKIGIPAVPIKLDTLADYPAALRLAGRLLGREQRAAQLSEYIERTLDDVARLNRIPESERVRVYYAEGPDGLNSDCDQSFHTEVINLVAGRNVYRCSPKDHYGMERLSLEQVMAYDPEVILIQDQGFYDRVYTDPRWRSIRAVKDRRVHRVPYLPFNWLDRPPSFMRALGVKWLAYHLYPERYPLDLSSEIKSFYRLFLQLDLDDVRIKEILGS